MSTINKEPTTEVYAEAAVFVAWLHGANRSSDMEKTFKRWLEMDASHAAAFERATEAWELGGVAAAQQARPGHAQVTHLERKKEVAFRRPILATAAALAMVCIGIFLFVDKGADVTTGVGEQRMLTLKDGTRIFLNTGTRLAVVESAGERRVRLDAGEAMFEVAKDPSRPFVVVSGDQQVVALGTSFVVRREPEQVTVTLLEGKVAVSESGASVAEIGRNPLTQSATRTLLAPGQRLIFSKLSAPKIDEPILKEITAWRRGEVILDRTQLGDAAEEMNRYSEIKLVIEDPTIATIRVSGIFRAGDTARFARAVSETYELHLATQDQRIVLSR